MDLKGSLIDTNLKIYPSEKFVNFLQILQPNDEIPPNFSRIISNKELKTCEQVYRDVEPTLTQLNNDDNENLNIIKKVVNKACSNHVFEHETKDDDQSIENDHVTSKNISSSESRDLNGTQEVKLSGNELNETGETAVEKEERPYLTTSDIDWLFLYLQKRRRQGEKDIPYLHEILETACIEMPDNKVLKRNPVLEARCVKLRAQQEAREYRKMTKSVDNVRIRFPEDSISYQLKQLNRQLIAIGQFIISIFAGFLFGFKGVEWMVGNLDFGFRLLLGVMCALVIALAEIYFLAKKLNEELNVPETIQLGGPPKFVDESRNDYTMSNKQKEKEHQD